jgi:uncharacterized membrane protein YjdF
LEVFLPNSFIKKARQTSTWVASSVTRIVVVVLFYAVARNYILHVLLLFLLFHDCCVLWTLGCTYEAFQTTPFESPALRLQMLLSILRILFHSRTMSSVLITTFQSSTWRASFARVANTTSLEVLLVQSSSTNPSTSTVQATRYFQRKNINNL